MNLFYVYYFFFLHFARLPRSEHHLCWQLLMELLVAHTNYLFFLVFYSQNFGPIFTLQKQTILVLTIQNVCMDFVSHQMPIRLGLNFFLSIFQYTFMFLFYTITPTFTAMSLCVCVWVCFFLCSIQHAIKLSIQTHWKVNRMRKKNTHWQLRNHTLNGTELKCLPCMFGCLIEFRWIASGGYVFVWMCVFVCVFVCVLFGIASGQYETTTYNIHDFINRFIWIALF